MDGNPWRWIEHSANQCQGLLIIHRGLLSLAWGSARILGLSIKHGADQGKMLGFCALEYGEVLLKHHLEWIIFGEIPPISEGFSTTWLSQYLLDGKYCLLAKWAVFKTPGSFPFLDSYIIPKIIKGSIIPQLIINQHGSWTSCDIDSSWLVLLQLEWSRCDCW